MVTQTISLYLKKKHHVYYLARTSDPSAAVVPSNCFYFPSKDLKASIRYYNQLLAELKIDVVINQGPFLPFNPIIFNPARDKTVRAFSFLHFMPGFEFERIKYVWMTEKKPLKRFFKQLKTTLGLNTLQYHPDKTRKKYRDLYHVCDRTVVLSPAYIDLFQAAYRLPESGKLTAIPNPSRCRCDSADILTRKKRVVLFAGRLELESKRVDRLLSIWKSIDCKEGWELKIVGDGPHREALERMVENEDITHVSFLGQRNDMESFYKEAAIIALTSTYEGLALCFIEAIQYGAVPISFDVSAGLRDILADISPDILIEPFAMEKYAECLQRLMSNDTYRDSIARKALEKGREYTLDSIGRQWDKLLE